MGMKNRNDHKWILVWLMTGVVMVYFQILLGGITRLTGSGLSITRWEIVTGTIPPLSHQAWEEEFALYRETPQYQQINVGMSLSQFKFIYFWEYIHRLWARTMGFVFIIPFLIFLLRGSIHKALLRRLMIVVGIAALAAIFGWIMVASGLVERPWVNAYKLTIHLGLGISLFIFLFYTWSKEKGLSTILTTKQLKSQLFWLIILCVIQVCFGGFVSGMKAALNYPTWPLMHSHWIPEELLKSENWTWNSFLMYDHFAFMPALVQFVHRNLGYILALGLIYFAWSWLRVNVGKYRWVAYSLTGAVFTQVLLGVLVLLGSKGSIPLLTGVLHQGTGILLLTAMVSVYIRINNKS